MDDPHQPQPLTDRFTRDRRLTLSVAGIIGVGAVLSVSALSLPPLIAAGALIGLVIAAYFALQAFSSIAPYAAEVETRQQWEIDKRESELPELRICAEAVAALPEPVFVVDRDGLTVNINDAAEALIGTTNVTGRHLAAVLRAPDVFEAVEATMRDNTERKVEFITMGPVEHSCRATITSIDNHILVFVRDLTAERRLEKMRADFIANASHELRTPLASLIGFIETLRGHAQSDPDAQKKFLKIMHAQAERMQRLVSDLMSLSRIELNEHMAPKDVVDLADIASDVIDSLEPILKPTDVEIDLRINGDGPTKILGDRDELFQTIQNLLDNAVKYGGENPMIKVRIGRGIAPTITAAHGDHGAQSEPGHRAGDSVAQSAARLGVDVDDLVYIHIRDFGPGISRSDLPRLTERFYRVSVADSVKSGGTGLGLAIVKHIVSRHRGGFQIESKIAAGTAFNCYFAAV